VLGTAVLMMGLVSCNDEEIINSLQEQKNLNTTNSTAGEEELFDSIFYEYIESASHTDLEAKVELFVSKINSLEEVTDFETKEQFIFWISDNLSSTSFLSVDEAITVWDEIEILMSSDFDSNIGFYEEVIFNKIRFSELLVEESLKYYTSDSSCKDDLLACNTNATNKYTDSMEGALSDYFSEEIDGEAVKRAMEDARVAYKVAIVSCQENYDKCIINSYD